MARVRWTVAIVALLVGLLQPAAFLLLGPSFGGQSVAAQDVDGLADLRQQLAVAPLPDRTMFPEIERPVVAFTGVVLVPPASSYRSLAVAAQAEGPAPTRIYLPLIVRDAASITGPSATRLVGLTAGAGLDAILRSDLYQVDLYGERISGRIGAIPLPGGSRARSCEGPEDYCVEPASNTGWTYEWFSGLTTRGQPAAALHGVGPEGSQSWRLSWYDPEADTSYLLYLSPSARRAIGAPARLGRDNVSYAAKVAQVADGLEAPYLGTVEGLAALRDRGDAALAAGERPGARRVANALRQQQGALAARPSEAAYQRSTLEWAELLLGGAWRAYWALWQQNVLAQARAANFPAMQSALREAERERQRLESVAPASLLAPWYQQALQRLTAEIASAEAIVAGQSSVEQATALGWGITPIFPALTDIPIDGGLVPVPQEFQAPGPEPGRAYYNVPPNMGLWDVARVTGPSCGTYPSPYGGTSIVRFGTYGYSGCFDATAPGQPPVLAHANPPGQFTPTPAPAPTATAVPVPRDNVALVGKTADPTVGARDTCRIEWEVRNTGTTTWRANGADGYKVRLSGAYTGEVVFERDIPPGGTFKVWFDDACGWVEPGRAGVFELQLVGNGMPFGPRFAITVTKREDPPTATPRPAPPPVASASWEGAWRGSFSGTSSGTLAHQGRVLNQCSSAVSGQAYISITERSGGQWSISTDFGARAQVDVRPSDCSTYYLTGSPTYFGPIGGSGSQLVVERTQSLGRANPQSQATWRLVLTQVGPDQAEGTLTHSYHDFDGVYDSDGQTDLRFTLRR